MTVNKKDPVCTICGYKATLQCDLTKHIQSKHKGNKYQCSFCDKEYKSASNLRRNTIHTIVIFVCQHSHRKVIC